MDILEQAKALKDKADHSLICGHEQVMRKMEPFTLFHRLYLRTNMPHQNDMNAKSTPSSEDAATRFLMNKPV